MRIVKLMCCCAVVGGSFVGFGGTARADDQAAPGGGPPPAAAAPAAEGIRLPVSFVERGITNPAGILSPVIDFGISHNAGAFPGIPFVIPAAAGAAIGAAGGSATGVELAVGAGYSITDDFGVRATAVSAQFNSPGRYFGPSFGATYRFMKGDLEIGAAVDVGISTVSDFGGVVITPSLPVHLHLGKQARLDVQPNIPISTPGGTTTVGLGIPVQIAYDIIEPLHVGALSGYNMIFNPPGAVGVGDTVAIPVGLFAGYAVAGAQGPVLDLDPFFTWTGLFTPGLTGNATSPGVWILGLEATYYLYL